MTNTQTNTPLAAPVRQALDCIAAENFFQAREILRPLLAKYPQEDELVRLYVYCLDQLDEQCENLLAAEDEKDLSAKSTSPFKKEFDDAYQLAEQKEYVAAAQAFGKLASAAEKASNKGMQTQALYQQAACYYLLGEREKAAQSYIQFRILCEQGPAFGEYLRRKRLMAQRNYTELLDILDEEISQDPNNDAIYLARARLFDKMNIPERALEDRQTARDCLEARTQVQLFSSYLYEKLAQVCVELGDYPAALAANAKAIALWPQYLGYRVDRVCLLEKNGQPRQAVLYRNKVCEGLFGAEYKKNVLAQGKACEAFDNYEGAARYYQTGVIDERQFLALKEVYQKMNCPEKMEAVIQKMSRSSRFANRFCGAMLEELLEQN